jgi:Carboxypeptidase regulatory-like domain/TonB dependent receptor-like, beta-barrel
MHSSRRSWFPILGFLISVTAGWAQTTGSIEGTVSDEHGQFLPGVAIEATSPSLQGSNYAITGEGGRFHLAFLPPGTYTVRCTLDGFSPLEQPDVLVSLGRTTTLLAQMRPGLTEEVVVTATAPTIDTSSTEVGVNIDKTFFLQLPIQRDFASVVTVAPGTSQDGAGTAVYGSTGAENAYYIDGVNTTGIVNGTQGKELNFEFIQEVQIKTGGYQAEFGRALGGVINVITRSGGNEFHGDGFAYSFGDRLEAGPKREIVDYRRENKGTYVESAFTQGDYGGDLGGYLWRDTLWFFAAYDRVDNDTDLRVSKDFTAFNGPPEGKVYVRSTTRDLWSTKLTWRLSQNHSLILSSFGDPTSEDGPLSVPNTILAGPESTFMGTQKTGGNDGTLKYQGIVGSRIVLDAQVSRHNEQLRAEGPGSSITRVSDATTALYAETSQPILSGGLGGFTNQTYRRDVYRADLTYLADDLAGTHEFKVGAEYEDVRVNSAYTYSGDQIVAKRCARGHLTLAGCAPEWIYYVHTFRLTSPPPGGLFDPDLTDYIRNPVIVHAKTTNRGAYLQDTWHPLRNLTLDLGLRWEGQRLYDRFGTARVSINDNWAPRLGVVWDWRGDGRSKLFGSWGRFYETVPSAMVQRAFTGDVVASVSNLDPEAIFCDPALNANRVYNRCSVTGGYLEPVDPAIKGEYLEELVLGAEVEVASDVVIGAKAIYRSLGRAIEDGLTITGDYAIGNPGRGLMRTSLDETYTFAYPTPQARRFFRGLELTARKRFSHNWQGLASYLYSKLEGNYEGNFQGSNGQLDPNLASAYDYAEFQIHNRGYLSNDRRHQFKVGATYAFPFGLSVGGAAFYLSGAPVTAMGTDRNYGAREYFLSKRGAWDRTNPLYEVDLHLGYPLKVAGVEVNLLLDVFNLLNRQGEIGRDNRYDLDQVLDVIDYGSGAILPAIPPGTACTSLVPQQEAIYCNPAFNTANFWQDPRSIRLGARVTF